MMLRIARSSCPAQSRVILDQIVQVEHRVLGQHERGQRLQVGFADGLRRP